MAILNDKNYRKYYKKTENIKQINNIDMWARDKTFEKIKRYHEKNFDLFIISFFIFNFSKS